MLVKLAKNHSVTALYEITFTDSTVKQLGNNRYVKLHPSIQTDKFSDELGFLRLRYKAGSKSESQLIERPVYKHEVISHINKATTDFRFSASVAAFAQQLRGGKYLHEFGYNDILELARKSKGEDKHGYRGEFVQLVSLASSLDQS